MSRGALGDVLRCVDEVHDRTVAAKLLSRPLRDESVVVNRVRHGWAIRSIVERAMAKDPSARWPSAQMLAAATRASLG